MNERAIEADLRLRTVAGAIGIVLDLPPSEKLMEAARAALAAAERVAGPTPAEIELMMVDTEHHRAGPVHRSDDGTLRVYYAGFNLTALSEHIARELAQAALALSPGKVSEEL